MNFPFGFIESLGGSELVVIMFVVLLLFGADKMPGLAKGIGKSVREFKKAASGVEEEMRRAMEEPEPPRPTKFPTHPPAPKAQLPGTVEQAGPPPPAAPPATPPPHAAD